MERIKSELLEKFDTSNDFINLTNIFNKKSFKQLLDFIFCDNDNLENINFDKLPKFLKLDNIVKQNVICLMWQILSLLRFPITTYNLYDKNACKEIFNSSTLMGKFSTKILFFLLPTLKSSTQMLWYPIYGRGVLLGYACCFEDSHQSENKSFDLFIDIWEYPSHEIICNKLIKHAKSSGFIKSNQTLLVFLLNVKTHSFYISGVLESICLGKECITKKELFELRSKLANINNEKFHLDLNINIADINKFNYLLESYAIQISDIQAHFFWSEFRKELFKYYGEPIILTLLSNLHLDWHYATIAFWTIKGANVKLLRGNTYRFNESGQDFILDDVNMDISNKDYLIDLYNFFQANNEFCIIDLSNCIDNLPKEILPLNGEKNHILPKSLLRILYKNSSNTKLLPNGIFEIYFFKDIHWLEKNYTTLINNVTLMNVTSLKLIKSIENEKANIFQLMSHTMRNKLSSIETQVRMFADSKKKKNLINNIGSVNLMLTAGIALIRSNEDQKYLNKFSIDIINCNDFHKLIESLIYNISLNDNIKKRLRDNGLMVGNNKGYNEYLMELIDMQVFNEIRIKTVPLLLDAILTEALINAFENCNIDINKPISFDFETKGFLLYMILKTKSDKNTLILFKNKLKNGKTGAGIKAIDLYIDIMSKKFDHSFGNLFINTDIEKKISIYKIPMGLSINNGI